MSGFGRGTSGGNAAKTLKAAEARKGKRAKNVFDTDEVPHLWAHQTQASARNRFGNLYFEGDTIYSYGSHFPIARHVEHKGKKAILFTYRTYSPTTSGHVHAVRGSIPGNVTVFHVYNPATDAGSCINDYVRRYNQLLDSAKNRKFETSRYADLTEAAQIIEEARAFAKFYGMKLGKVSRIPAVDKERLKLERERKEAREEKRIAKQKVADEVRRIAHATEVKAWEESGVCQHEPKHDFWQRYTCEQDTKEAKLLADWEANKETYIAEWRAGARDSLYSVKPYGVLLPTMLRIEGDEVYTSKGARFPIKHAKQGLRLVRAVVARGEEWKANGHTLHLGHYSISRIEPDGTVHAGCHVVPLSEIEAIAPGIESYTEKEDQ